MRGRKRRGSLGGTILLIIIIIIVLAALGLFGLHL
jgi:hypothetical protein